MSILEALQYEIPHDHYVSLISTIKEVESTPFYADNWIHVDKYYGLSQQSVYNKFDLSADLQYTVNYKYV